MPIQSIGDLSKQFTSLRSGGQIKSDLARLSNELSTGRVSDVTEHLGGDTRQLSGINHSLKMLKAYKLAADETSMLLNHLQLSLGHIDSIRESTTSTLFTVTENSSQQQIGLASEQAKSSFQDIVSTLNGQFAGKHTMGGTNIDSAPLVDADAMLSDILAAIGSTTTTTDIKQIVSNWFDDPSGGFATFAYQGQTGSPISKSVQPNQNLEIDVNANDQSIRNILKATALAAVISELPVGVTLSEQGSLIQFAGTEMLGAASDASSLQSRIGYLQESVEVSRAQIAAETSTFTIAFNDLTSADPFETATQLEAVRTQLETHFTITGRLSRLSLVEYI